MPLAPAIGTHLTEPQFGLDERKPHYRVQAFAFDPDTLGIGDLIADFPVALNVGWGDYVNDVPDAFWTLRQDDPHVSALSSVLGRAHIRILRDNRIVWTGWLMESDESDDDVVFYAYGYLAGLYWVLSEWKHQFTDQGVSEIVRLLWRRAITQESSMLAFVATGSIEGALTANGSQIVLPTYAAYYKRLLYCMQEIAALGLSDTDYTPVFEITHEEQPRFNFWSNRGMERSDIRLEYGDNRTIAGYRRARTPVFYRNVVRGVGSLSFDALYRQDQESSTGMGLNGRREEPLYLAWVRDETEMDRILAHRLKAALREDTELSLSLFPNSIVPPGGRGARFRLSDAIPVKIDNGATQIDDRLLVRGVQVVYDGDEHVRLLVQDKRRESPSAVGERVVVSEPTNYVAFPGIARAANGDIIVTYRSATDHATTLDGVALAKISENGGKSFGSEVTIYDDPSLDVRGVEVMLSSTGTLIASFDTWNGGRDDGGSPGPLNAWIPYVSRSTDNGATWGSKIAVSHGFLLHGIGHASKVVQADDGTLMYPIYGADVSGQKRYCVVVRSTDDGLTWGDRSVVAQVSGEDCDEPNLTNLGGTEWLCMFRGSTSSQYFVTRSLDDGRTWDTPVAVFDGAGKAGIARLDSGKVLAVVRGGGPAVDPDTSPDTRDNEYRISLDGGRTWSDAVVLDSRGRVNLYASVLATGGDTALAAYGVEISDTKGAIYLARFA